MSSSEIAGTVNAPCFFTEQKHVYEKDRWNSIFKPEDYKQNIILLSSDITTKMYLQQNIEHIDSKSFFCV